MINKSYRFKTAKVSPTVNISRWAQLLIPYTEEVANEWNNIDGLVTKYITINLSTDCKSMIENIMNILYISNDHDWHNQLVFK